MFADLLIIFMVVVGGYTTGAIAYVCVVSYWHYILLAAEPGIVVSLSAETEKMSVGMARALFFLYVTLNGIVFCAYLVVSDLAILWTVLDIIFIFFGIMTLISWFGNANSVKIRPFMMGGLIFLVLFWLLAMFIDPSTFGITVSMIGTFLPLIFTVYDTKKVQAYHAHYGQIPEVAAKAFTFTTP